MTHKVTITDKPASGDGDISGFTLTCEHCKWTVNTSLRSLADIYAFDHVVYMAKKESRSLADYRAAVNVMRSQLHHS